jgi:hypothetical protein
MNKPKFKQGDRAKLTEKLKDKLKLMSYKYEHAETVEIKREPRLNERTNQFVYWCDCIECRSTIPIAEDELVEVNSE